MRCPRAQRPLGFLQTPLGTIRLNTDLAKKPPECLESIIVHEMTHLVERTQNKRFRALLNQFMPGWVQQKALLNELPVRHEEWG